MTSDRCDICGMRDDDAHLSQPHVFEPQIGMVEGWLYRWPIWPLYRRFVSWRVERARQRWLRMFAPSLTKRRR